MENELLPCPFCGGEAHVFKNNLWHVACERAHNGCVAMSAFVTEAEAIAAWNTRAEYHGYEDAAVDAWKRIKAYQERTCRIECFDDGVDEGMDGEWFSYAPPTWYLSCGHTSEGLEAPKFCSECGSKVVDA